MKKMVAPEVEKLTGMEIWALLQYLRKKVMAVTFTSSSKGVTVTRFPLLPLIH